MGSRAGIRYPTPAHQALADRAVAGLRDDPRVVAVFIGGSLATGDADEESDLDLTVAVRDEGLDGFWEELESWLHLIGRPVAIAPGPVPNLRTAVMQEGLRVDVAVLAPSDLTSRPRQPMIAVYDTTPTAFPSVSRSPTPASSRHPNGSAAISPISYASSTS